MGHKDWIQTCRKKSAWSRVSYNSDLDDKVNEMSNSVRNPAQPNRWRSSLRAAKVGSGNI